MELLKTDVEKENRRIEQQKKVIDVQLAEVSESYRGHKCFVLLLR